MGNPRPLIGNAQGRSPKVGLKHCAKEEIIPRCGKTGSSASNIVAPAERAVNIAPNKSRAARLQSVGISLIRNYLFSE
jgi:hypothetical protein